MENINWSLIIYLSGVIIAYIIIRIQEKESKSWNEVFARLCYSSISWLGLVVYIIYILKNTKFKPIKIPKWL